MRGMGFRDLEFFNLAMLARQAWRILINPEFLCSQLLKVVYFPSDDLLSVHIGTKPSKT
jgi:hypothetical protein